jgi:signal transduction histidine kinase
MSHELRTPLNAIVGYSELLAEDLADLGDRQMQDDIGRVAAASRHLASIIGDILDYAKLDTGDVVVTPQPVDVAAMLRDLTDLLRPGAAARGLTLHLEAPAAAWAQADPVRLRQVLLNLMGNAVKFTERGGVRVRVRPPSGTDNRLVVVVHDTGVGIPRPQQAQLFQPFVQAHVSSARALSGSGLGLVISRRLAEAMGGSLRFRSRPGAGSSFRLSVPGAAPASRAA